jgi:hypothetical protein
VSTVICVKAGIPIESWWIILNSIVEPSSFVLPFGFRVKNVNLKSSPVIKEWIKVANISQ